MVFNVRRGEQGKDWVVNHFMVCVPYIAVLLELVVSHIHVVSHNDISYTFLSKHEERLYDVFIGNQLIYSRQGVLFCLLAFPQPKYHATDLVILRILKLKMKH